MTSGIYSMKTLSVIFLSNQRTREKAVKVMRIPDKVLPYKQVVSQQTMISLAVISMKTGDVIASTVALHHLVPKRRKKVYDINFLESSGRVGPLSRFPENELILVRFSFQ